jgi:hypothetical protein
VVPTSTAWTSSGELDVVREQIYREGWLPVVLEKSIERCSFFGVYPSRFQR